MNEKDYTFLHFWEQTHIRYLRRFGVVVSFSFGLCRVVSIDFPRLWYFYQFRCKFLIWFCIFYFASFCSGFVFFFWCVSWNTRRFFSLLFDTFFPSFVFQREAVLEIGENGFVFWAFSGDSIRHRFDGWMAAYDEIPKRQANCKGMIRCFPSFTNFQNCCSSFYYDFGFAY